MPSSPVVATNSIGCRGRSRAPSISPASASMTASPRPLSLMPGPIEPIAVATNREVGPAREHGVEMRADDDGAAGPRRPARRPMTLPASSVWTSRQAAVAEAASDPTAALVLFARRRRDLRDGDLRAHDRVVARGQPRVRRRERAMRRSRVGRRSARAVRHAYQLRQRPRVATQVVDSR